MTVDDEWLAAAARRVDVDSVEGHPGCTPVAWADEEEDAQRQQDEKSYTATAAEAGLLAVLHATFPLRIPCPVTEMVRVLVENCSQPTRRLGERDAVGAL